MTKLLLRFLGVLFFFMYVDFLFLLGEGQQNVPKTAKIDRASMISPSTLFYFIENRGQMNDQVNFHIKMPHGNVLFADGYIDYQFIIKNQKKNAAAESRKFNQEVQDEIVSLENVRLRFLNPNPDVNVIGTEASQAVFNFYKGNDPSKWVDGAASYKKLVYEELWPFIDLVVYEHQGKLKHEYVVRPGGNIDNIRFTYEGVENITVNDSGQLEIKTRFKILKEDIPVSYQMIKDKKYLVTTKFKIKEGNLIGFNICSYFPEQDLIIDPSLFYSLFLGGSSYDSCQDIAIDLNLNAYVVGTTSSTNFPTTPGAYDWVLNNKDAFISKLDSTGADLLFSTYFGGTSDESGSSIRYSWGDDCPVIAGSTGSNDLPTHANAYDKKLNGGDDVFIAKFTSTGQFKYATYLGGNDSEDLKLPEISIDGSDNIYVGGLTNSSDFVTTPGVIDPIFDPQPVGHNHRNLFITKFNPQLSTLGYSTFFGKDEMDFGAINADYDGNAYLVGKTHQEIPTTPGVYQENFLVSPDGFVTKIAPDGKSLVFSTYIGGGDYILNTDGIDVDGSGNVYIAGDYLTDEFFRRYNFIHKYSANGSTQLNFINYKEGWIKDIALDGRGGLYIVGNISDPYFDVTDDAFQRTLAGDVEAFVRKFDASTGDTIYSTFFGGGEVDLGWGIAADSFGAIYIAGSTYSQDFPTTPGSYSMNYHGNGDGFVARIRDSGPEGDLKLNKHLLLFTAPYHSAVSRKRNIKVSNIGKGIVNYTIYTDQKWLTVAPDSGDVRKETDTIAVTVTSTKKMKPGTHAGAVKVYSIDAYNSPQNVLVKLKIKGPAIKLNKKKFSVSAEEGGENPKPLNFLIRNKGPGTLRYRIKAVDSWLSTKPKRGVSTGERDKIKIFIDITGMTAGTYTGTIEIAAKGSVDPPEIIEVELIITE